MCTAYGHILVHVTCGILNPNAQCMVSYPKKYCETTSENSDGYSEYIRRDNGITFDRNSLNKYKMPSINVDYPL